MSGLPVVAASDPAGANLTPVKQVEQASLTTERNLFEYLAQQSISNSLGNAATLANPSAIAAQLSRHLRGFMERAAQQGETTGKKVRLMNEADGTHTANLSQTEQPRIHAGPARERLAPSDAPAQRADAVGGVTNDDYNEIIDALTRSMHLMISAEAIVTGSGNVTKSMQTLMRGQ